MDEADYAQVQEAALINHALAARKPELRPIVLEMDGTRFGVCHYCESAITPGHLFCPADVEPEHSCSVEWEHTRKRREDSGV